MRKMKVLQYYYTRLTVISLLSVCFLVCITTMVTLTYLQSSQNTYMMQEHDAALKEMEACFNDVWNNYYKAFIPLTDSFYEKDLYIFCRGEDYGYDRFTVRRDFTRILADSCQQDRRIKGIYFRRFSDGAGFLYSAEEQRLYDVDFGLGAEDAAEAYQRVLVGGRKLHISTGTTGREDMEVFGIQSGVQTVWGQGKAYDYQITVLYGVDIFDQILAEYDTDSEARFLITSDEGMVLYDSWGEYEKNREVSFAGIGEIAREGDSFANGTDVYRKEVSNLTRGGSLAFYLIPQGLLTGIRLNGVIGGVSLLAVAVMAVVSIAVISMNRLANRKFQELEWGMGQIGKNNLGYRLPLGKQEDEFFRIAIQFNKMCDDLEDTINKNYAYQSLQQNAEYKVLQTSVNPHFLYNSLEAIREMLDGRGQEEEAAEMVLLLSRIFEYQIRGDSIVSIQKEIDVLRSYIDFWSIRFRYSFEYSVTFDEKILNCPVPKQIFQPIVENYFAHGLQGNGQDYIDIRGYLNAEDGMIYVRFRDNGKGLSGEAAEALTNSLEEEGDNSHIGLRNVHHRLKLIFGEESHVTISSNAPEPGVTILLVFGQALKLKILG